MVTAGSETMAGWSGGGHRLFRRPGRSFIWLAGVHITAVKELGSRPVSTVQHPHQTARIRIDAGPAAYAAGPALIRILALADSRPKNQPTGPELSQQDASKQAAWTGQWRMKGPCCQTTSVKRVCPARERHNAEHLYHYAMKRSAGPRLMEANAQSVWEELVHTWTQGRARQNRQSVKHAKQGRNTPDQPGKGGNTILSLGCEYKLY